MIKHLLIPYKLILIILTLSSTSGCHLPAKLQTPFSIEDPTIAGQTSVARGLMLSSTQRRYWFSYKYALDQAGYETEILKDNEFPYFKTKSIKEIKINKEANYQFWKDGEAYAKILCSDFFRRIALTKSHRNYAKQ